MTELLLHPDVDSYLSGHQKEDRIKEKLREAAGTAEHYLKGVSNRAESVTTGR